MTWILPEDSNPPIKIRFEDGVTAIIQDGEQINIKVPADKARFEIGVVSYECTNKQDV